MTVVVSLREFVGEMQILSDESHAYLNKLTGELIMLSDDDLMMAESNDTEALLGWQAEFVEAAKKVLESDDYLELPSKFDIHEYDIMQRFCVYLPDERISDVLLGEIRGPRAFRRFKDSIHGYSLEKDWFRFRDEAHKEIAISWLESKGIAYKDDVDTSIDAQ